MSDFKIYVADLAAYNQGILHGVWIDVLEGDIQEQVNAMLTNSPVEDAEEWAIHDYDGFEGVSISEYENFDAVVEFAEFLQEHEAFGAALLSHWCNDIAQAHQAAEECYTGCHESVADYARSLTEDTSEIPAHLEHYIDYERMGRDMELNGDIYTLEVAHQEVHIFWSH
jgi:antirestriction protein